MDGQNENSWSRREFLEGLARLGAASLLGATTAPARAEPPPETPRIRLVRTRALCVAPQYLAEDLLKAEGFAEVEYVRMEGARAIYEGLASGKADVSIAFVAPFVVQVDAGLPIVLLAGIHSGCFELFGTERVRAIRDLKGKRVAVWGLGSAHHVFLASMAAYVGVDPRTEIAWVTHPAAESMALLAEGRIDAYLGFPPDPQELRARKIGHVVVNSALDRPWSQYFCCLVAGNRDFVRRHPAATKRAVRALLKAADACAAEPARAARSLVDRGFAPNHDFALQTMTEIPYRHWRDYDPEDTVRFFALRLREAGMIKSNPQKIIAQGTDWRFLRELQREMKA